MGNIKTKKKIVLVNDEIKIKDSKHNNEKELNPKDIVFFHKSS